MCCILKWLARRFVAAAATLCIVNCDGFPTVTKGRVLVALINTIHAYWPSRISLTHPTCRLLLNRPHPWTRTPPTHSYALQHALLGKLPKHQEAARRCGHESHPRQSKGAEGPAAEGSAAYPPEPRPMPAAAALGSSSPA